jgi:ABC-type glycerol-3-phosphate transport system substrate-binding protein
MVLWVGGAVYNRQFETALGVDNVGIFPAPSLEPGAEVTGVDAGPNSSYGITTWSEHADEAWRFLEFLASETAQRLVWDEATLLPNRRDVAVASDNSLDAQTIELAALDDNFTVFLGLTPTVNQILVESASGLVTGELEPEEVLARMDETRNELIERLGG